MNNTHTYLKANGDVWSKVFLIINHIIILPILLGNILLLIAYTKSVHKRKYPSDILLINLAIADVLTGLIGIPWTAWVHYGPYEWDALKYPCLLSYAAGHIPLAVSCITILFIGSARCVIILKPFSHKLWITCCRMRIVNLFTWIYSTSIVLLSILRFNKWHDGVDCDISQVLDSFYMPMFSAHLIFVAVISTAFCIVFIKALKQSQHIEYGTCHNNSSHQERRKTIMVMLVVACFYACWLPSAIYAIANAFLFPNSLEPKWSHLFQQFSLFLLFTNSFMNPFIYAGLNQGFRTGIRESFVTNSSIRRSNTSIRQSKTFIRPNHLNQLTSKI